MPRIREFLQGKKWKEFKKSDWFIIALAGVLLLIIAIPTGEKKGDFGTATLEKESEKEENAQETGSTANQEYAMELEERLEGILSQMDGVGKVRVMITLSDSGETIVEKDRSGSDSTVTETDSSGGSRTTSEKSSEEETIYVENGETTYPYVGKEILPSIEGVVVVAEGGGNASVISNISDAVMALFPVEAHRIKVVKMSSKEE